MLPDRSNMLPVLPDDDGFVGQVACELCTTHNNNNNNKINNNNINRAACQLKIAVVINFQLQLLMEITRIFYDDRVKPDFCI